MRVPHRRAGGSRRSAWLGYRSAPPTPRAGGRRLPADRSVHDAGPASDRAVEVGLDYLRQVGVEWSPHPTEEEVRREYERMWSQAREPHDRGAYRPAPDGRSRLAGDDGRPDAARARRPCTATRICLAGRRRAVTSAWSTATATDRVSLMSGSDMVLGPSFGDYTAAFAIWPARLRSGGEARPEPLPGARTTWSFATSSIRGHSTSRTAATRAARLRRRRTRPAISHLRPTAETTLITNLLATGDSLVEVQREAETGLEFAREAAVRPRHRRHHRAARARSGRCAV